MVDSSTRGCMVAERGSEGKGEEEAGGVKATGLGHIGWIGQIYRGALGGSLDCSGMVATA